MSNIVWFAPALLKRETTATRFVPLVPYHTSRSDNCDGNDECDDHDDHDDYAVAALSFVA